MNRERLKTLRDHLAGLPDEKLDMRWYVAQQGFGLPLGDPAILSECGTTACIAGWAAHLFGGQPDDAGLPLHLSHEQSMALFCPDSFENEGRYTRTDAIAAIDSMLANPDDDALPVWPEKAA